MKRGYREEGQRQGTGERVREVGQGRGLGGSKDRARVVTDFRDFSFCDLDGCSGRHVYFYFPGADWGF